MANLETKLTRLHDEERRVLKAIDERNRRQNIKCGACGNFHRIGSLEAIQTHWYTPPSGCTEGDYWNEGELRFVCPETGIVNRLLFDNYDVPYEKRRDYDNDPEEQFKRNYKKLFKKVMATYDKDDEAFSCGLLNTRTTVNNHYVDQNRGKFGLVEKLKNGLKK